jgi:hypothetical protein
LTKAADQPETARKARGEMGVDLNHNGKSSMRYDNVHLPTRLCNT